MFTEGDADLALTNGCSAVGPHDSGRFYCLHTVQINTSNCKLKTQTCANKF